MGSGGNQPGQGMTTRYNHHLTELTGITGGTLGDVDGLSAVAIAAAGAVGLSTYGPPIVKSGPQGIVAGLLCHGGHIILHTIPESGICVVDILARAPASPEMGAEVIAKRLGAKK